MAVVQGRYKWMLFLSVLATALVRLVSTCHPSSKELHICLNIYLERDFPLIETIVKGLQDDRRSGRGRVILEGPDLANICKHIASLKECYTNLLPECDTMWQYDRYMRVMDVLGATHDHLCLNGTNNVRDLLWNSGCLTRNGHRILNCSGFDWAMSWRQVLRMQVSPQERCSQLESYRECLKRRLSESQVSCGSNAPDIYLNLIDVWLRYWCGKNSTPVEDRRYFFLPLNQS